MRILKTLLILIFVSISTMGYAQDLALWLTKPAISPDGSQIAFCYKGDIFIVSSNGGQARQLTSHPDYDTKPVWSPDGKTIAFSSDRKGGFDIYTVPVTGGAPRRITLNSSSEMVECFTPDGKSIVYMASGIPDPNYSGFPNTAQVYTIPVAGGRPSMLLTFPAYDINFSKDGSSIIYHDKKGYENIYRKHEESSICRDIWTYELSTKNITRITNEEIEDRNPIFTDNDKAMYFLYQKSGNFNIWKMSFADSSVKQITNFKKNPVRNLSKSNNNTLCFTNDGQIYIKPEGKNIKKLTIYVAIDDVVDHIKEVDMSRGASEYLMSPNGKEFAFILRGDVFVANCQYGTTKRITNTPQQERSLTFSPDGRFLAYASERNGMWNIYMTSLSKTDKLFCYANGLREYQVTKNKFPSFQPEFSPKGGEIAYIANRAEIRVVNLKKKKSRVILPAKYNYSYSDGDQYYTWSPDGKWILAQYFEKGGWQNTDLGLIKADGSGEIHNLTQSAYHDVHPKFMLDGKVIIWASDRNGMRSHGSWGSQYDAYAMFLDDNAWKEFRRTPEESALAKQFEAEKKQLDAKRKAMEAKKAASKKNSKKNKKSKDSKKSVAKPDNSIKINFTSLEDRKVRLTSVSSSLRDAYLAKDGQTFLYISSTDAGTALWMKNLKKPGSLRMLSPLNGGAYITSDKSGKSVFLVTSSGIRRVDIMRGKVMSPMKYSADFVWNKPGERKYIFNHAWEQVKDKFYDSDILNPKWAEYKKIYEKFLPHINNNYDFADLLSELLGELNASHTGSSYRASGAKYQTAILGAFYDDSYKGDGLKIKEIIENGPLTEVGTKIKVGTIILAINGKKIKKGEDYYHLLKNLAGKSTRLTLKDGKKEWVEVVKPTDTRFLMSALYKRWIKHNAELTDKLSNGKVAYIHVKEMNSPSFRNTYSLLLGKYRNRKAVIIDTRHNGGGWLHEDLIHLLSGKKYAEFVPRGQYIGQDPFNQWTKPSCVLVCEDNYSNAHGFPWAYKELGIGKLIGMPVPGTMTAVWWEKQIDPSIVFGIPQVGMKDNKGRYLENLQLEPDVKISNDPKTVINGEDKQLEVAVKEMLKEINK